MSKRLLLSLVSSGMLMFGVSTSAVADDLSGWNASLGGGALLYEGDDELSHTALYNLSVGYDIDSRWTVEGSLSAMPNIKPNHRDFIPADDGFTLSGDTWGVRFGTDYLYHFNPDATSRWDPFGGLTAGLSFYRNKLENGQRWDPYAGLASGLTFWMSDTVGLRADHKIVVEGHDTEFNNIFLLSLTYSWGRRAKAMAAKAAEADTLSMGDASEDLRAIYFAFDSSSLTTQAKQVLKENADYLASNPGTKVVLEGHCDERGTEEYNLALGERRARSAFEYLRSLGVTSERMTTVSYGESRPADPGKNEAAYAKNRRVECVELSN